MADYDVYCLARDNGEGKPAGIVVEVVPAGTVVCNPMGQMLNPARFRWFRVTGVNATQLNKILERHVRESQIGDAPKWKLWLRSRYVVNLAAIPQGSTVTVTQALAAITDRLPEARAIVAAGGTVNG